jgi:hypothetical protein
LLILARKYEKQLTSFEGDGPISVVIIKILDSVKRYYDSTYETDMEYANVRRHIANAVALNVLPPGYVAPAPILVEGAINALINPEIPIPDVPPLPHIDAPVAWDLDSAWKQYCLNLSAPFMAHFKNMVMEHTCMDVWRAASLADPVNMQRTTITPAFLRLTIAPLKEKLVPDSLIDRMISELSEYEKACSNLDWSNDTYAIRIRNVETFWATHKLIPAWTEFTHLVFLLQPTSACVERAFSILKYIMGDQQVASLSDKIEMSLMLRYNRGLNK